MEEARAAWEEVGARFNDVGSKLKQHFEQARAEGATDALKDALRDLGAALDGAVEAVASAAKDQSITDDMRKAGQSLVNAVGKSFADVSEDLRNAFSRTKSGQA
jgi:phage tail tape-measure protein